MHTNIQLQTTSPESKFPNEYIGVIFIQIDQHLKKLFKKYKGFRIFWNTVYTLQGNLLFTSVVTDSKTEAETWDFSGVRLSPKPRFFRET